MFSSFELFLALVVILALAWWLACHTRDIMTFCACVFAVAAVFLVSLCWAGGPDAFRAELFEKMELGTQRLLQELDGRLGQIERRM